MALSTTEIDAVVRETATILTGGWVQRVFQPTARAIILEIRAPGRTVRLLLSAEPGTARVHLLHSRPPNPQTPPPFCQYLRAHIQGGRVERVERVEGDRIIRLGLTSKDGPCTLIAALTGRSADLLLLDAEDRILNSLIHGREKAGKPYSPPRPRPGKGDRLDQDHPVEHDEGAPFPVSQALERRYQGREEDQARRQACQARLAEVRKAEKKLARRMDALRADLEKAERYRDYARYGELLKTNLGRLASGHEQITVVDYYDPAMPELVIPLDPAKSPLRNMDDYFKKHRKHLTAEREVRPRLLRSQQELEALRGERKAIEQGTWEPMVQAPSARRSPLASQAVQGRGRSRGKEQRGRAGPFKRFISSDGVPIYVGRNARENEELTHRLARSEDLWFHARGAPGSHVVVRLEKGADPPAETLRDAATLALLYSDLKKSGKGEVIYTRKKWVRKAKGQAAGSVHVTQEKSIFVTLDKTRLDGLKERSR